ncbi:MAG: cellulase family glycosylhydrolase [Deltaproteobacteria bacterium]|nr:cellulase family glycosylhydrolase [Deltaproteobacteria bacterium]MBN2672873.1 cellulase family glycosylhydrolase [Deltaproteobacteria bacterium]
MIRKTGFYVMIGVISGLLLACGGTPASSGSGNVPTMTIGSADNVDDDFKMPPQPEPPSADDLPGQVKTTKSVPQCDNPKMLRVDGSKVVDGSGKEVILRGVAFGNNVWDDDEDPRLHHNEKDFERIAKMGMNTVRFYLNYKSFESDAAPGQYKEAGWKWLDDNVTWAKAHGVYLIFNMHVPPGGYQSLGEGKALWDDPSAQKRLINLWKAIAERYKDEPMVAGLDFLNEPVVSKARTQWHELAGRIVAEVRKVDPYHIFFIERINGVDGDWKEDAARNFFLVDDPNVVYEFHFYKPFHFTHQGAPWVDFAALDTRWPDESRVGVEWFLTDWETATFSSPTLPAGDSDWTYYEGAPFHVTNDRMALGKPTLACNSNDGKAYFDDVVIEEVDEAGKMVQTLRTINLVTKRGWYFWNPGGAGEAAFEESGHGDNSALSISGNTGDCNLGAEIYQVKLEKGKRYRAGGWMKGENIAAHTRCQVRLDISSAQVPLHQWDKRFLAQELDAYLEWGKRHNVPLFLGEWGTISDSFQDNRGGERWVADMLALLKDANIHWTYHSYHEKAFALYWDPTRLPDESNANDALIKELTKALNTDK